MDFELNKKVYGFYNRQYPLVEGRVIGIGAHNIENFYIGKLYTIQRNNGMIFEIPAKHVFATYEEWEKFFDIRKDIPTCFVESVNYKQLCMGKMNYDCYRCDLFDYEQSVVYL